MNETAARWLDPYRVSPARPAESPPGAPAARWRVPLVLVAVLLVLTEAATLGRTHVAAGVAALATPWRTPAWFCPRCSRSERVIVWLAERPTAAQLAQRPIFDSF